MYASKATLEAMVEKLTKGDPGDVDVAAFADALVEADGRDAMAAIWAMVHALMAARLSEARARLDPTTIGGGESAPLPIQVPYVGGPIVSGPYDVTWATETTVTNKVNP